MGCCNKVVAKCTLALSSLVFLAIGCLAIAASVTTFGSPFFKGLVAEVAIGGVALGLACTCVACAGFGAVLSCKRPRTWLAWFLCFDLAVTAALLGVVWFTVDKSSAVSGAAAAFDGFNGTAAEQSAEDTLEKILGSSIGAIVSACEPNATALAGSGGDTYAVTCAGQAWLGGEITSICFGPDHAVNASAGSDFASCYADSRGGDAAPGGPNATLPQRLASTRGIFCQCSGDLARFVVSRLLLFQFFCVGVAAFFLCAFASGCYLCCCAKYGRDAAVHDPEPPPPPGSSGASRRTFTPWRKRRGSELTEPLAINDGAAAPGRGATPSAAAQARATAWADAVAACRGGGGTADASWGDDADNSWAAAPSAATPSWAVPTTVSPAAEAFQPPSEPLDAAPPPAEMPPWAAAAASSSAEDNPFCARSAAVAAPSPPSSELASVPPPPPPPPPDSGACPFGGGPPSALTGGSASAASSVAPTPALTSAPAPASSSSSSSSSFWSFGRSSSSRTAAASSSSSSSSAAPRAAPSPAPAPSRPTPPAAPRADARGASSSSRSNPNSGRRHETQGDGYEQSRRIREKYAAKRQQQQQQQQQRQ